MSFLSRLNKFASDQTREKLCESLRGLGVDARLAEIGPEDADSLGRIDIRGGPIRWIRVRAEQGSEYIREWAGLNKIVDYFMEYGVPDDNLRDWRQHVQIGLDLTVHRWLLVRYVVADLWPPGRNLSAHWEENDRGLGILKRLNGDPSLTGSSLGSNSKILNNDQGHTNALRIWNRWEKEDWVISVKNPNPSSREHWTVVQTIARHLLAGARNISRDSTRAKQR